MKNDKELYGTLIGFDDFVNMLMDDVTEVEYTVDGKRITKLEQILLNGNNIAMVSNIICIETFPIICAKRTLYLCWDFDFSACSWLRL